MRVEQVFRCVPLEQCSEVIFHGLSSASIVVRVERDNTKAYKLARLLHMSS
jgi:hypothetical protein